MELADVLKSFIFLAMRRLLLCLLLFIASLSSSSQEFTYDGINYQILDTEAKTCSTRQGTLFSPGNYDVQGDIVLPENPVYNGEAYTLTEIGDCSFSHNSEAQGYITSITFPNTITRIGRYAFSMQEQIQHLEIPESVVIIDDYGFTHNWGLTYVQLNNGLKTLGRSVFCYCGSLTELELPSTLETIASFPWENDFPPYCNLQTMIINRFDPPTITNGTWPTLENSFLYVPTGAKENYLKAPGWNAYSESQIIEINKLMVFLDRTSATMIRGSQMDLPLICTYDQNNDATFPREIQWESSDESVVTAVQGFGKGIVKAVGEGNARVTVTVYPNSLSLEPATAYCDITVQEGNISFSLSEKSVELRVNQNRQLIVDIQAIKPGNATLTVSMTNDKKETITESCDITVLDVETEVTPALNIKSEKVNIYDFNGNLILQNVSPETVKTLSPGFYIVGDKKILLK